MSCAVQESALPLGLKNMGFTLEGSAPPGLELGLRLRRSIPAQIHRLIRLLYSKESSGERADNNRLLQVIG